MSSESISLISHSKSHAKNVAIITCIIAIQTITVGLILGLWLIPTATALNTGECFVTNCTDSILGSINYFLNMNVGNKMYSNGHATTFGDVTQRNIFCNSANIISCYYLNDDIDDTLTVDRYDILGFPVWMFCITFTTCFCGPIIMWCKYRY